MDGYINILTDVRQIYVQSGGSETNVAGDTSLDHRLKGRKISLDLSAGFPRYLFTPRGGVRIVEQVVPERDPSFKPDAFLQLLTEKYAKNGKLRRRSNLVILDGVL